MKLPILSIIAILTFLVAGASHAQAASSILFSPETQSVKQNDQFSIQVHITADQAAYAADAVISYTATDLEFVSAVNGGFFDTFSFANDTANGRLELHGYFINSTQDSKTGNGLLATVQFKAKKTSGTGTVSFACSNTGTDTFILNTQGTNILSCANTNSVTVTYSSTATHSPTPSTTVTPTQEAGSATHSPTVTQTPAPRGNDTPSCTGISYLPTANITTLSTVTVYCQGSDNNGFINGGYFDFGNKVTKTVSGRTDNNNKVSATYTYPTAGTYRILCLVKDNDGMYSGNSTMCTSSITVKSATVKPSVTTAPTSPPGTTILTPKITQPVITLMPYNSPTVMPTIFQTDPTPTEIQKMDDETTIPYKNPIFIGSIAAAIGLLTVFIATRFFTR